ncbi:MAG: transposase [Rhizobiaceae bacterium]
MTTCTCSRTIPSKLSVADLMRKMRERSSHKVQQEITQQKKRCWGRQFWDRGYFSATNGAITEETIVQYLENLPNKSTGESQ